MVEREFNSATKDGNSVFMVDLSSEITKLILNGKDIITGSDLKIYNTDNMTIDSLVDRVVYKVLRTLYVANVFKKVPNENYKTNNFTLSSYAEDEPKLLAHLFYGFFNILGINNIPLDAGALTMAFHNYPTQEALDEMTQFIRQYEQITENNRKYRTSRIYSNNQVSRPNSLSVLGYNKR
jgi:hypothetical protein